MKEIVGKKAKFIMTKVDIFSGFLGAGKTTLIKKLIAEAYAGEKLVLIENEFGEIGIDGGFLQDAGIEITEMNSGCICCSLVGDFTAALKKVVDQFHPDRILIEPSGVGKLSDVIRAVQNVDNGELQLNSFTTVVDATKCKMYMKNFGEFFNDQVEHAGCIVLSRTDGISEDKLQACISLLRQHNGAAVLVTTPWASLTGAQILEAMEHRETLESALELLAEEEYDGHEHDHVHEHEHTHEHEHEHDHGHEHGQDEACSCGHHHHHGHHADEMFNSWGVETAKTFSEPGLQAMLAQLDSGAYGQVLRAKGIVAGTEGWLHFDYVPGDIQVRKGYPGVTGRLCVIGAELKEESLKALFEV